MRSVIAEGFVIGLLASVLGLLAGIGLAKGLLAMFAAMGVELPDATTVIASRTVFLSVIVGTLVTVLASILPARRATRVPPIAAVREGSTLPPSPGSPRTRSRSVSASSASRSRRSRRACSVGSARSPEPRCSAAAC